MSIPHLSKRLFFFLLLLTFFFSSSKIDLNKIDILNVGPWNATVVIYFLGEACIHVKIVLSIVIEMIFKGIAGGNMYFK